MFVPTRRVNSLQKMPEQEFEIKIGEIEQIFRPRHQDEWPIWETREELKQPWTLGFPKMFVDGNWYRLAQNGGTAITVANRLLEGVITTIEDTNLPEVVDQLEQIVEIEVGTTEVTENQFKDGYLQIKGGTGVAYNLQIGENESGGGTAGDKIKVYLAHEAPIKLDKTSDVQIITNPNKNIRVATGSGEPARGTNPTTVESNYYFWKQHRGVTVGQAGEGMTESDAAHTLLQPSTDAGKYATYAATAGLQPVGKMLDTNAVADDEYFALELFL